MNTAIIQENARRGAAGKPWPASFRPVVLVSLSDAERADEIAAELTEERGLAVRQASGLEALGGFDVVLSDAGTLDGETPHVLIRTVEADDAPATANVRAVLPDTASARLVAAALTLAAAGYRVQEDAGPAQNGDGGVHAQLTPREREVLELLSEGAANKVIARRLDISVHTAKFHVAAIIAKLGAVNRTDAIAMALREGLVHL